MDPLAAIKATFFQECEEQLAELETGLLALEAGEQDPEVVNAVFRAVHSIKGGAGAFGLEALVRFAHVFETALDHLRSGSLAPDPDVLKVMLRAADVLADHVRAAIADAPVDEVRAGALAVELSALTAGPGGPKAADLVADPFDLALPEDDAGAAAPSLRTWSVRFRPHAALYAKANEAALLLRELDRLGPCEVALDESGVPSLDELDPEGAYLGWTVSLATAEDEAAIREVFEFVDGDCDLAIEEATAATASPSVAELKAAPSSLDLDIAALLQQVQVAAQSSFAPAPPAAMPEPPASVRKDPPAEPPPPARAEAASAPQATIRVDLERVDRMIDLVGELVINQAMLAQRVAESGMGRSSDVAMGLDELEQLTREIQDSVMAIRAQPVKSVFQRMPRLVREVAAMTGKEVRLVTDGEGTEVDKTVIERLSDPITHMIRNAIDHGLESPEDRARAGKPAEGVVRLSALHRSGRIVIEVSDDGRGINRERVKAIAVRKGLIAADAALSDEEIDNLIFMPGFSTADAVSDISGRGVGMDVVRRSIQALGGRISIASRPGLGSTFTLSLPLTLAVLDGMVVSVCGQTFVAPLSAIVESLQPKASNVRALGASTTLIAVRDTYTPLIDVGLVLGHRDRPLDPTQGVALLVEGEGGARAALLVDAIQGQRQVVIKSLEANYRQVPGIAAATILGDGRVALILDVDAVVATRGRDAAVRPELLALAS